MNRWNKSIWFVLILLLSPVSELMSQKLSGTLYTSNQGISNNEIKEIYQDSRGFIWICSNDGLNRYDGYDFLVFRRNLHDSLSIGSNRTHCIDEDHEGNLWIGTEKGISKYDIRNNRFINISFVPPEIGMLRNEVFELVFDRHGNLWCLLYDRIIQYRTSSGTYSEFFLPENFRIPRNSNNTSLVYYKQTGTFLVGTPEGVLFLNENNREPRPTGLTGVRVNNIYVEENSRTWISSSEGLFLFESLKSENLHKEPRRILKSDIHNCIPQPREKMLLLNGEGIILFDQLKLLSESKYEISIGDKDFSPLIRSSLLDQSDNLWIGTSEGMMKFDLKPVRFRYYSSAKLDGLHLSDNNIFGIYTDKNHMYVGSWPGGLQVIDMDDYSSIYYSNTNRDNYLPDAGVVRVFRDSSSRIWVLGNSVHLFEPETGTFKNIRSFCPEAEEKMPASTIYFDMIEISKGLFLIAHNSGLSFMNTLSGECHNDTMIHLKDYDILLYGLFALASGGGDIWASTSSGLLKLGKNREVKGFFPTDSLNGLSGIANTLKLDSKDRLWVGTSEGLFRLNEDNSSFTGYNVADGFANDNIYSIEEDYAGKFWLGTNKGLIRFDPQSLDVNNYGIQHGLSGMEFNLNASHYSDSGYMYFGAINGLNYFHPTMPIEYQLNTATSITGAKIFRPDHQHFLPYVIDDLNMNDNEYVQLFFSVLDYTNSEFNEFKYRMYTNQKDSSWHYLGSGNSIILSGLVHGEYTFEVLGRTQRGEWTEVAGGMNILVHSPFYRRKAFLLLMSLPFLVMIYFFFEYRLKTLRRSNKALREKEIAAKEVLRQKNLLSRRNKNIEDSLKYAQRIQYAMFTSAAEIKKMIPESFILQKPKDIVSGDFYWGKQIGSKVFLAAADCTGHGVPGAFMSLIGLEFFRQIIGVKGIYKPSLILDELNRNFDLVFDNLEDIDLRDGMDLAFCVYDSETKMLEFAGAFNPVYIVRNGEIIEIKGERITLGPDLGFGKASFTNREMMLEKNDMLYMFSDGYADQFGGPEGKKFKFRRFRHLLLSLYDKPVDIQKAILENSIMEWKGIREQVDDIMVIGFKPYV